MFPYSTIQEKYIIIITRKVNFLYGRIVARQGKKIYMNIRINYTGIETGIKLQCLPREGDKMTRKQSAAKSVLINLIGSAARRTSSGIS